MTREEIMLLDFEGVENRASQIVVELADADAEGIETLNAELEAIEERKSVLNAELEEKRQAAQAVAEGAGKVIETRKDEKKMTDMEIRNSHEYIEAFAKYIKTGKDEECRALLTENVQNGTVAVPTFVADIVAERVKESKILARVTKMNAGGNVKVPFEISAPAALTHTEGGQAQAEELLSLGIVTLVPTTYKKWVGLSDETLDSMSGEAYLRYVYDEVARGIIKAEENAVVAAILAAPQTATASAPAVAKTGSAAGAITDFVDARALLGDGAEDLVIICSKSDRATYKGLQMAANYGVDPFDGLEVIESNAATVPIIGDLRGVMVNRPKGDAVEIKYDDKTRMKEDMVDILGRQAAAIGVVGNLFFAKVSA